MELPPGPWHFNRKHIRLQSLSNHWIKLNSSREDRVGSRELKEYLVKYAPKKAYMSVMDYLRPQLVGPRRNFKNALPVQGAFVADIDSYMVSIGHDHYLDPTWVVCVGCLQKSKAMTLRLCDRILEDYSNIQIVFSGKRGFHVWVMDFDYKRYVRPNPRDPFKTQASARYKYARTLTEHPWDRAHFILSCDPLRVMTVPNSLNLETGLVCLRVGSPWVLENLDMRRLVEKASPLSKALAEPYPASMIYQMV